MAVFGIDDDTDNAGQTINDIVRGCSGKSPAFDGVSSAVWVKIQSWLAGNLRCMLYDDADDSLVAVSADTAYPNTGGAGQWLEVPLVTNVFSAKSYSICAQAGAGCNIRYLWAAGVGYSMADEFDDGEPDPWVPVLANNKYQIYCVYSAVESSYAPNAMKIMGRIL